MSVTECHTEAGAVACHTHKEKAALEFLSKKQDSLGDKEEIKGEWRVSFSLGLR